jgi:uncharacterized protein HemX
MLETIKAYAKLIVAVLWVATVLGAYFYRAWQDSGQVKAAETAIAARSDDKLLKAQQQADRVARALQAAADVRAQQLQDQVDATRTDYEKAKLQLAAARLPSCPIPVAAIELLYTPSVGQGGSAADGHPGPAAGSAPAGTVDASEVIANEELNKQAYERNLDRAHKCITQYDDVRSKLNPKEKP